MFKAGTKLATLSLCLGLVAIVTPASAGRRFGDNEFAVEIRDDVSFAWGVMSATRNTSDSVAYLTCYTRSSGEAGCSARNSAGLTRACVTTDLRFLEVIRYLRAEERVNFSWDANGACTSVGRLSSIQHNPKLP